MSDTAVITRAATSCEDEALAQLTALDDRHRPSGTALLAEVGPAWLVARRLGWPSAVSTA